MSSVPERPDDDRDEADGVESSDDERRATEAEPSDEDWSRLARVVARLLAGSWAREQPAAEQQPAAPLTPAQTARARARHARRIAAEQAEGES